ncbi:SAV_2336 N-terminal domain-related protein [Streptomyces silvisoli]|uniref:SAV_2336 N-terminal domain-related protein n=1 Tax=Streptomyces silvisoli TaxID=3034235 RepID=A0ABT5ZHY5_9ACTN|nr:SAV_2336 N-terminal domain-related protein [Streptomyces silvisoli]MDF3289439.1 SAV_2336 N-terminal domain-related protein [Streptomyces silvisoli]
MATGSDPYPRLIARLRAAGIAPDAEALADALWLARAMGARTDPRPPADGDRRDPATTTAPSADHPPRPPRERPESAGAAGPDDGERREPVRPLRPDGLSPQEEFTQIRVPIAAAFPGLLPLERALRPLQRYRPRIQPVCGELDETATAETSARSGQLMPVFEEVRRREASLLLVMDDSPSMVVWDQMLQELRLVCEHVGAFRDVCVQYLRSRPDGLPGVGAGRDPGEPLAPADRLRDPTGRTITLLLSDCSGALWRRGAAQRLLHRFAGTGPVAVLQPLPQRMWPRTLLPAEPGLLRGPGGPGGRLDFVPRRRRSQPRAPGALAVPVLSPTQSALGAWARAVAGTAPCALDASAAWVHDRREVAPVPRQFSERTPEDLVQEFQAVASPAAQHLAVYLSAAPLAYPVMQLVQRAMMPQTGPVEMAEVLLSGLLLRHEEEPRQTDAPERESTGPWYEFVPGVRDVLLRRLGLGEASLVLKHCSLYVERVFGRRARNFPAMVVGYLSGGAGPSDSGEFGTVPVPEPFAEVPRKVLRRFQPGGVGPAPGQPAQTGPQASVTPPGGVFIGHQGRVVDTARDRLARFQRHGTIRDLWEAIRLLRTAPADDRQPRRTVPLRTLLAECLLSLWETRPDDGTLVDAEQNARLATEYAVDSGVLATDAARAHLVLGRVLRAQAAQAERPGRKAELLAEAADSLERSHRLLRGEPHAALEAQLCGVEVAKERYDLGGDRHLLIGAALRLDEVLGSWPYREPLPDRAQVARGGLLLALSEDAARRGAADEARSLALRAVADFEAVAATATDPSPQTCQVLLELAAARAAAAADPGALEALAELRRALAVADALPDQPELTLECLRRLGRAHAARYAHTADTAELAAADRAFARAQRLLPTDDPDRAQLLVERGRVLAEWTARGGGLAVATDAVRVLREALAQTPESHPLLAERRLVFGRALRQRRAVGGAQTDLYEAEWILDRAARGASPGSTDAMAARAWLEHGGVLLDLAEGPGAAEKRDQAAESFRRAADSALRAGELLLAAQAYHQRGTVLERTAGRARALEAYRCAWELWQRSGAAGGPQARSTRERMLALEEPE